MAQVAPPAGAAPDDSAPAREDLARLVRLVFDASANAMVLLDDERRVRCANRAAAELLDVPRDRLLTLRIDDFTPDWLRPCLDEGWPLFLRHGVIVQRRSLTLADGRTIQVGYRATANVVPGRHLATHVVEPAAPGAGYGLLVEDGAERSPLTPRELEIVQLLARGMSGAQIAERLVISPDTVRTHIRNAREKRGARTRAQLIAGAVRDGLVQP